MKNEALAKQLKGIVAAMKGSTETLESMGVGSQRILEGFKGKIKDLEFQQLTAAQGVTALTRPQVRRIVDEKGQPQEIVLAKEGEFPVVLNYVFEDGRTVSVNALRQSAKSTFEIEGVPVQATNMNRGDWHALIGKTITCTKTGDDDDNIIRRPVAGGKPNELSERKARYFNFTVEG